MKKIDKRTHLPYYESWVVVIRHEKETNTLCFIRNALKSTCWYQFLKELKLTKNHHALIIAESGLSGKVYRYNNYGEQEIMEVGTTEGYA